MTGSKRRLVWKITLVSSLLSPFVLFSSGLKPWQGNTPLASLAQELIYPVEFVWSWAADGVTGVWRHYFALSDAAKQNTELRSEIVKLKTRLLDYDEQLQEIGRLRDLLGFVQHYERQHLVAEVIGSPRDEPFYTIRIGKGSTDEVMVGMPVMTAAGVVGRVVRTGLAYSDVQLVADANFHLDVLLQRTRVRGVLKGMQSNHCLLKLNRRAEIRIGDTVITSGIVGGFPKGLPVGRVVRISYESDNISQTITVEPWVDYQRVEEVIVLKSHDPELQKISDTAGKDWLRKSVESAKGG